MGTYIVTGAAGGVGRASVEALVARGDRVVAEDLDPAQPLAERDLGRVVDVETAEDEHAVLVERLQRGGRQRLVVDQPLAVDADDLGADRG